MASFAITRLKVRKIVLASALAGVLVFSGTTPAWARLSDKLDTMEAPIAAPSLVQLLAMLEALVNEVNAGTPTPTPTPTPAELISPYAPDPPLVAGL
jgi:hypothetical protein